MNLKKKLLWTLLFAAIAIASVWTITSQSRHFSMDRFLDYLRGANPFWVCCAVVGMLGFIFFEATSLHYLCRAFDNPVPYRHSFVYSASDIYFSAVTPSATGGQPASGYFMMKDGVSAAVTTVTLLLNLTMYTIAIFIVGGLGFLLYPGVLRHFGILSKILILSGALMQGALVVLFFLLIYRERLLKRIASFGLRLLCRLHLMRDPAGRQAKLDGIIVEFRVCAHMTAGRKRVLFAALMFNVLQRISQFSVTVFLFLATGGSASSIGDVFATQSMVVLGSNSMPIPGAVGVADYLLIDGFRSLIHHNAVNLELFSRALSFYGCVIICGVTVIIKYLRVRRRDRLAG